jgi:predicted ribosome quality control (RQC) complex YloA/Tae2 family protein
MNAHAPALADIVDELQPLVGARLQRIDRIDPRTWVFELRAPGRTLRLLVECGPGARIHLVDRRPPRRADGGDAQRRLRKRIGGQRVAGLRLEGHTLELDLESQRLLLDLRSGAVRLEPRPEGASEPPAVGELPDRFPLNEAAAAHGHHGSDRRRKEALRRAALVSLGRRRKKQRRLVDNVERDLARLEALAAEAELGELLKSVLQRVSRGASEVHATDWATGDAVVIPLQPDLSPVENLDRIFARAKRGRRGVQMARARRDEARAGLDALDAERARIEALQLDQLDEDLLRSALGERSVVERSGRARAAAPIDRWSRRFEAADGTEIRVGRGAKENDRLTLQGARGHDRWLHVRGGTGAHVVLRCEPGRDPHPEAVLDAAHLAVHYSEARREGRADVMLAEARHVKKTKGAPPGRVGVAKSRTLHVVIEPERLRRLLAEAKEQ